MWEIFSNFVMAWLDPIGVVLGLLISIPIIWTWYEITFGRRRRERRWYREVKNKPGERPGILVVDLLPGKNVRTDVENCRQQSANLKAIPRDRIVTISRDKRITPEDIPKLTKDIRQASAQLMSSGVDTLHYYHAGPAMTAAIVGAEFANGCRVLLYQHKQSGYENFGPLRPEE